MEKQGGDCGPIDLDKLTVTLEPDKTTSGGLQLPGKDRVIFKYREGKSLLGLDVRAMEKREAAKIEGNLKVPQGKFASVVASLEEEEMSALSEIDEIKSSIPTGVRNYASRQYRGTVAGEASISESNVTEDRTCNIAREHFEQARGRGFTGDMYDIRISFTFLLGLAYQTFSLILLGDTSRVD